MPISRKAGPVLNGAAPTPNYPLPEAYSISDAIAVTGIGRTKLYQEINSGRLKTVRLCGRRLILRDDLLAWLHAARDGPN